MADDTVPDPRREKKATDTNRWKREARLSNSEYRDRVRKQNREWKQRNPEKTRELKRASAARRHLRKIEALATRPKPDRCELCDGAEDGSRATKIMFDHCHKTQLFRGWICHRCNCALGYLRDDADVARRMAVYLENHKSAGE